MLSEHKSTNPPTECHQEALQQNLQKGIIPEVQISTRTGHIGDGAHTRLHVPDSLNTVNLSKLHTPRTANDIP